jgi:hypothetical protein
LTRQRLSPRVCYPDQGWHCGPNQILIREREVLKQNFGCGFSGEEVREAK